MSGSDADQVALEAEIVTLPSAGHKDQALRRYFQITGDSPKRAKQAIKRMTMVNNIKTGPCFIATACTAPRTRPRSCACECFATSG